ncbi:MAG: TetR/AcrR family transcriptional regulator [Acholeplasmataceae bacterium]
MPKDMFFAISSEKREHVIDACFKEFSTKLYQDITISSLAKKASISRGTFYNYFDSVGSCLTYLISLLQKERYAYLPDIFKKNHFDIFRTVRDMFSYDYEEFLQTKKYSLIYNYILYLRVEHLSYKEHFILKLLTPLMEMMQVPLYQKDLYHISEDQFYYTLELFGVMLTDLLLKTEKDGLTKEETFERFDYIVNLIEKGIK